MQNGQGTDSTPLPQAFAPWFRQSKRLYSLFYGVLALNALHPLASFIELVDSFYSSRYFPLLWSLLNTLVIAGLFGYLLCQPALTTKRAEQYKTSSEAVRAFKLCSLFLWGSWMLLYGVLALRAVPLAHGALISEGSLLPVLMILNNAQSVAFLACFVILAYSENRGKIIIGVCFVGALITLFSFIAAEMFPGEMIETRVSSVMGCLTLVAFISRLGSKYLCVPLWVQGVLLGYALLQLSWVGFENRMVFLIITSVLLAGKVLFYGVFKWLLASDQLLFYFEKMQAISRERVEEELKSFRQTLHRHD